MIIHYEFFLEMIRLWFQEYSKDIKIHSLHLNYHDRFMIHSIFDYKGIRSSLKGYFDLELSQNLILKNIQGTIHSFLFKMDLYPLMKELCKSYESILFEDSSIIIKFDKLPFYLSVKEIQSTSISFDIHTKK